MRRWVSTVALLCALAARGDTVRTLDGGSFEGVVRFEGSGLIALHREGAEPVRVSLTNLSRLTIKPAASAPEQPQRWQAGTVGNFGSHSFVEKDGVFSVRCVVTNIFRAKGDGLCFIHQPVEGAFEIVARVAGLPAKAEWGMAGLALREDLGESSRSVALLATGSKSGTVLVRESTKRMRSHRSAGLTTPCSLKLVRFGDRVTAYRSEDGQNWKLLDSVLVPMEGKALVGFVLGNRKAAGTNEVEFSGVSLTQPEQRGPFQSRLILADGGVLVAQVGPADTTAVRCTALGQALSISTINVVRMQFQPLMPEFTARMRPGRTGVLLASGDFVDGEFKGLADGRVRISSVLFGLRTYAIGREAMSVAVREGTPGKARFELRLADGSLLNANTLSAREGAVAIEDGWLNGLRIPVAELREVRRSDAAQPATQKKN